MSIIGLLILLIVFCVVVWAARAILTAFAIPDPIRTVIWVGIVIVAVLILLSQFGGMGGLHFGSLGRC